MLTWIKKLFNIESDDKITFTYNVPKHLVVSCYGAVAEVYKDKSSKHRWRIRDSENRIIAASQQGFKTKDEARTELVKLRRIFLTGNVMLKD